MVVVVAAVVVGGKTHSPAVANIDPVVLNERQRTGKVNRLARLSNCGSFCRR
jgi:hypothetical protein